MSSQITRAEADLMALRFLRDSGPDTMGPIETDEAFAAALIYVDLKRRGLITGTKMAPGYVQWAITAAGLEVLG